MEANAFSYGIYLNIMGFATKKIIQDIKAFFSSDIYFGNTYKLLIESNSILSFATLL